MEKEQLQERKHFLKQQALILQMKELLDNYVVEYLRDVQNKSKRQPEIDKVSEKLQQVG